MFAKGGASSTSLFLYALRRRSALSSKNIDHGGHGDQEEILDLVISASSLVNLPSF